MLRDWPCYPFCFLLFRCCNRFKKPFKVAENSLRNFALRRETWNFSHSGKRTADMRDGDRTADDEGYVQRVDHFVAAPAFFAGPHEVICDAIIAAWHRRRD